MDPKIETNDVLFRFGTEAQYNALPTKDANTLYFLEDAQKIYKGDQMVADVSSKQVVVSETKPTASAAEPGVLYIVTTGADAGMYVKADGATDLTNVGGAELSSGSISDIGMFNDTLLDKSTAGALSSSDDKIPTSKAVDEAIKTAITPFENALVDVQVTSSEGSTDTVLEFTDAQGTKKTVTIADIFLSGAEYNPETHILTLTIGDNSIDVDLSALVPQAVTAEQVSMSGEITITSPIGNLKPGDKVSADNVQEMFTKILSADHNPVVSQPTVEVLLNDASAKEVGSIFTPSFQVTLNPGSFSETVNGAQPTEITATGYSVSDSDGNTSSDAAGSFSAFTVADNTNYRVNATVNHSASAIPKTYLGVDYPAGKIEAGTKSASSSAVTGYRQGFFGALPSKAATIDSASIRTLNKTNKKVVRGETYQVSVPEGTLRVIIAYEASIGAVTSITSSEEFNAEIKDSFQLLSVQVADASGTNAVNYNVYVKDLASAQEGATTYTVTI